MSHIAWSHPIILLLALPLGSCFNDETACSTCPPDNGARIDALVPKTGVLDSVRLAVDGGAPVIVRRGQRGGVEGLSRGTHDVEVVRWIAPDGVVSARTSLLRIQLDQGEVRVIVFHNDFPLVAWSPGRADAERAPGSVAWRAG